MQVIVQKGRFLLGYHERFETFPNILTIQKNGLRNYDPLCGVLYASVSWELSITAQPFRI